MKYRKIWMVLSVILFAVLIATSQGMEPHSAGKYLVACLGGGFLGLAIIMGQLSARQK